MWILNSMLLTKHVSKIQHNSYQDSNDVIHRTRTNISKMYTEPQKAPHINSNPEKEEQSWRIHAH